jgi:hypothetical protein
MPDTPVIVNNTPLVVLWLLGRLDILRDLYGEVWIPETVRDEFLAAESSLRQAALANAPWIRVISVADVQHARAYTGLDQGEAEVIALAVERKASLVIVDERRGRRYAARMGLNVTGSLGILLLAKERTLISALAPLLEEIERAGLYLAPELKAQVLSLAGERLALP